ncbi:MarR family winged helix-turn-helix transcriptional regulator [Chloroflexota bacterium]
MVSGNERLVQRILQLGEQIYGELKPSIPLEWLSSDVTVTQLRTLLVLRETGPTRMSSLAAALGTALPTTTGVVDNLVKKGLAAREADESDRRLVICKLSPDGANLINSLWLSGQFQMERLLEGLSAPQLEKAAEVARILFDNIKNNGGSNVK